MDFQRLDPSTFDHCQGPTLVHTYWFQHHSHPFTRTTRRGNSSYKSIYLITSSSPCIHSPQSIAPPQTRHSIYPNGPGNVCRRTRHRPIYGKGRKQGGGGGAMAPEGFHIVIEKNYMSKSPQALPLDFVFTMQLNNGFIILENHQIHPQI